MSDIFGGNSKPDCPVCKGCCIKDAEEIISSLNSVFSKCPECRTQIRDRRKPPGAEISEPCPGCGKRFIDDVMAHCYLIMSEEGEIPDGLSLAGAAIPLVTPGFAMKTPPYLSKDSLVIITPYARLKSAERIVKEVSEVKGVVRDNGVVPGVVSVEQGMYEHAENTLLAGCDVRCDVFYAGNAPFVIFKNQSAMHIEFPRGFDPKINSVASNIRRCLPDTFVDACSGAGTLGIAAALFGVNNVVFSDIWYPAAFWTAANLYSNRKALEIEKSEIFCTYNQLKSAPVYEKTFKSAHFEGKFCSYDVYFGDYKRLPLTPGENITLAAIDIFDKKNTALAESLVSEWKIKFGGDAFIP